MKRLSTGTLAALMVAGLGLSVLSLLGVYAQGNSRSLQVAQGTGS